MLKHSAQTKHNISEAKIGIMLLSIFWDYPELIFIELYKTPIKLYNLDIVRINKYSQQ